MSNVNTPGEIKTITGKLVNVTEFTPEDFDIHTTISVLCALPRFMAHSPAGYSVGVHSMIVCLKVWKDTFNSKLALAALFHDAAEVFIGDMPSPIKHLDSMYGYRELEEAIEYSIALALGVEDVYKNPLIKEADLFSYGIESLLRDLSLSIARSPYDRATIYFNSYVKDTEFFKQIFETLIDDIAGKTLSLETINIMSKYCDTVDELIKKFISSLRSSHEQMLQAEVLSDIKNKVSKYMEDVHVF